MKAIVLSVFLAIVLIQVVESTSPKQPLKCHICELPEGCKRHNETVCAETQDTCVRIHRPITDPSGTENKNNYYAKYTEGVMVWGRGCTTKEKCEKEKQKKLNGKLNITVKCCQEPLCNT